MEMAEELSFRPLLEVPVVVELVDRVPTWSQRAWVRPVVRECPALSAGIRCIMRPVVVVLTAQVLEHLVAQTLAVTAVVTEFWPPRERQTPVQVVVAVTGQEVL
jgi:hypothetical protein